VSDSKPMDMNAGSARGGMANFRGDDGTEKPTDVR
jgi:hypothetical protein